MKKVALAEIKDQLSKFLSKVEAARRSVRAGRGVRLENIIGSPKARPTPSSSNSRGRKITLAAA